MGILQQAFEDAVHSELNRSRIVNGGVRVALRNSGIALGDSEIEKLCLAIESWSGKGDLNLNIEGTTSDVHLDGGALLKGIDEYVESISEQVSNAFQTSATQAAESTYIDVSQSFDEIAEHTRELRQHYCLRIRDVWGPGIDHLAALLQIAQEAHGIASDSFESSRKPKSAQSGWVFGAMKKLQAKACRTTSEIIALLESGHADGAMARWRSLHEVAVITYFLSRSPAYVSKRFLDFAAVERFESAKTHQLHAKVLGNKRISRKEMRELQEEVEDLRRLYGQDFISNDYGWVPTKLLPKRNFYQIEKYCRLSKWRPKYKLACKSIHAGALGLDFSLSLPDGLENAILLGPGEAGLAEVGHSTALSLTLTTTSWITRFRGSGLDELITCKVMLRIADTIGELFLESHNSLRDD